jgi:hypothetical protein
LRFRLLSIAFVAFWRGRFWCETGAVRSQSKLTFRAYAAIGFDFLITDDLKVA